MIGMHSVAIWIVILQTSEALTVDNWQSKAFHLRNGSNFEEGNKFRTQGSDGRGNIGKSCLDDDGNVIEDGNQFTPSHDPCKTCHCQHGSVMCVSVQCSPPECKFKQVPGECCKFVCEDDGADVIKTSSLDNESVGVRMIGTAIASLLVLTLLIFMIYRLRQRRRLINRRRVYRDAVHDEDDFTVYMTNIDRFGCDEFTEPPPPYTPRKSSQDGDEAPPPYSDTSNVDSTNGSDLVNDSNNCSGGRNHTTDNINNVSTTNNPINSNGSNSIVNRLNDLSIDNEDNACYALIDRSSRELLVLDCNGNVESNNLLREQRLNDVHNKLLELGREESFVDDIDNKGIDSVVNKINERVVHDDDCCTSREVCYKSTSSHSLETTNHLNPTPSNHDSAVLDHLHAIVEMGYSRASPLPLKSLDPGRCVTSSTWNPHCLQDSYRYNKAWLSRPVSEGKVKMITDENGNTVVNESKLRYVNLHPCLPATAV